MEHVTEIRMRLERCEYEIDAAKVADAILERLLHGRTFPGLEQDR